LIEVEFAIICFPSMGGILSFHSKNSSSSHRDQEDDSYSSEMTTLRRMIKDKSKLILLERYVFILYCPPSYPLNSTAEYIRDRVDVPIFPPEEMENLNDAMRDEKYAKGFILLTFSSNFKDVEAFKLQIGSLGLKLCLFFFEMDGEVRDTDTAAYFLKRFSHSFLCRPWGML
jgi:hypothetical protein